MRIRITDVNYVDPQDADDLPLSYWGVSAGDEFDADYYADLGTLVIECDAGYVVVYSCECEVIDE